MDRKTLYTLLAVITLVGLVAVYFVSTNYEPGVGSYDPNAVIVGLIVGLTVNSFVLILLLVTLRAAADTVRQAEEIKALSAAEEKEHVILIEGIGEAYASRLNQNGIITINQLMDAEAEEISAKIGVTAALVRDWQAAGQLMLVKGIGPQYAEILVMAGVRTIGGLAQSDAAGLTAKIDAIEGSRKTRVVGTNITQNHVDRWIAAAKEYLRSR